MGNIGAEAILLAILHLYQERWGPDTRFILAAWQPYRMRHLVEGLPGHFEILKQPVPFDRPSLLRQADDFVVGGDVALTETVIPILPSYWAFKALWAKAHGSRVVFMGIEVEPLRRAFNRWAVRHVLDRVTGRYLVRNEEAGNHLRAMTTRPDLVLVGCEPALTLKERHLAPFPAPTLPAGPSERLVAFGLRDFFTEPLRLDIRRMKLVRRDARPGELSPRMKQTVALLAHIADRLVERHNARLVMIPHHAMDGQSKVILSDREVAEKVQAAMRHPDRWTNLPDYLHPFSAMNVYRQMDLVVSMRHHANSFAYRFGIPTIGLGVSEKIKGHFRQVGQEDLLLNPQEPDPAVVDRLVDHAVLRREALSEQLQTRWKQSVADMTKALDAVFPGA